MEKRTDVIVLLERASEIMHVACRMVGAEMLVLLMDPPTV